MWVEWDIGGLKHKFQRLMKWYDATKKNYNNHFFQANFLHHRGMDFANVVVGTHVVNKHERGWEGDYYIKYDIWCHQF